MKTLRVSAGLVSAIIGGSLALIPAQADAAIQRPFQADSGDACLYGATEGVLAWQYGFRTSPLPLRAVDVKGTVTDHPVTDDPGFACRDDGYSTTASFTAYSGLAIVAEKSATANNAVVDFAFTFTSTTNTGQITRIVVRVCRNPLVTLPPSYCGKPAEYNAPPVAGP
ncbi:MAG TPA: hypothetical protein VFU43_07020 [Streptosporangiaceae bacterium]|nr:hypothetical protein [Streptosporangiaceae bacterium]